MLNGVTYGSHRHCPSAGTHGVQGVGAHRHAGLQGGSAAAQWPSMKVPASCRCHDHTCSRARCNGHLRRRMLGIRQLWHGSSSLMARHMRLCRRAAFYAFRDAHQSGSAAKAGQLYAQLQQLVAQVGLGCPPKSMHALQSHQIPYAPPSTMPAPQCHQRASPRQEGAGLDTLLAQRRRRSWRSQTHMGRCCSARARWASTRRPATTRPSTSCRCPPTSSSSGSRWRPSASRCGVCPSPGQFSDPEDSSRVQEPTCLPWRCCRPASQQRGWHTA